MNATVAPIPDNDDGMQEYNDADLSLEEVKSRDEQLVRAAQLRAQALTYLSRTDKAHSLNVLIQVFELSGKKGSDRLRNLLDNMVRVNLISKIRDQEGVKYAAIGFEGGLKVGDRKDAGVPEPLARKPKITAHLSPKAEEAQALKVENTPVQIDFVKRTGRIRIKFKGLVIEIGVEE